MKRLIIILASAMMAFSLNAQEYPFRNPSLPQEQRIDDLLSRLTLEEKVEMMMNGSTGVPRLDIPNYNWWNEALHGVARAGIATVFPQAIGMAATFDPEEHLKTFNIISDEARAKYNEAIRSGHHLQYYGLSFWTPNINIFRDPRWGRGQETYGEDPYLTTLFGVAAVRGLQGDDEKYYKTHACAKHFAVHSGPEGLRHQFDATTPQRDLWETYLPAFRALVDADVQEVMGAYNRYAGEPCCASDVLLVDILRGRWNYKGLVVSDCGAINDFFRENNSHHTHPDAAHAAADAVITGTDIECGSSYRALIDAVEQGLITEDQIDIAMRRVLKGWFDLGMLDPQDLTPWANLPYSIVASKAHAEQSLKIARKSMVLLKNDGVLPVKPGSVKKIAVLGPNAADSTMMLGNYNGDPVHVVTILQGIQNAYPDAEVSYERGCDLAEGFVAIPRAPRANVQMNAQVNTEWMGIPSATIGGAKKAAAPTRLEPIASENYTPEALAALAARAAESDVIVFVGGISPAVEGEELRIDLEGFNRGDRERIELPEVQVKTLKALHATGKPVIFVLCCGSTIGLENVEGDYDALINAWYSGQEGGTAVADVITGAYNPTGKLPLTFYKSTSQLPDFEDYSMDNRTYRYFTGEPLYPFGFGLSYTSFSFKNQKLSAKKIKRGQSVTVKVDVSNIGSIDGDEAVQVYVKRLGDATAPIKALKGLKRAVLKAGETKTIEIELPAESFEYYDAKVDDLAIKSGKYQIMVGSSSADSDLVSMKLKVKKKWAK